MLVSFGALFFTLFYGLDNKKIIKSKNLKKHNEVLGFKPKCFWSSLARLIFMLLLAVLANDLHLSLFILIFYFIFMLLFLFLVHNYSLNENLKSIYYDLWLILMFFLVLLFIRFLTI
jgi:hypothetical protein